MKRYYTVLGVVAVILGGGLLALVNIRSVKFVKLSSSLDATAAKLLKPLNPLTRPQFSSFEDAASAPMSYTRPSPLANAVVSGTHRLPLFLIIGAQKVRVGFG